MRKLILVLSLLLTLSVSSQNTIINSYVFANEGSSLNIDGLVSLWNTTSIDATATSEGNDVDLWTDTEDSNNATQTGTVSPELHIGVTGGDRQVTFDGSDWLQIGDPANLGFIGKTDPFSIVVRLGDNPQTTGYFISKADGTSANRQWGLYYISGNIAVIVAGGLVNATSSTLLGNDLIILTVSTTVMNIYHDNVQLLTDSNINGTSPHSTANVNIGGRSDGGFLCDGDIEFIAVYNKVLSGAEISAIEAEFIINYLWWIILIGFKRKEYKFAA